MADISIETQISYCKERLNSDIHRFAGWLSRGVMHQIEADRLLNTQRAVIQTLERERRRKEPREFKQT